MHTRSPYLLLLAVTAAVVFGTMGPDRSVAGKAALGELKGNLFASAVISHSGCIVVGDRGRVYLSNDGAKTWKTVESKTKNALASVCFPDERHGWIVGQGGVIVHSADGGQTWLAQPSGVSKYLLAVDFIDMHNGYAVGADAVVVRTTDGGKTWRESPLMAQLELEDEFNLFTVVMMDVGRVCAAGDSGRIFISEDAGQTWQEALSPLYDHEIMDGVTLYSLAHDQGTLYAVGLDSAFMYSRDQGKTWVKGETGFPGPELYCVDFADGLGLAAGSGGHVIRTSDQGATWGVVPVPEQVTWGWLSGMDVRKDSSGDITGLVVGQNGMAGQFIKDRISW